jgi:VCBS repeat-containing protein
VLSKFKIKDSCMATKRNSIHRFIALVSCIVASLHTTAQVTAHDDDFLVNENEVWTGNLAENDILPAGTATFSVVEGPSIGEFEFTNGGNFLYTPPLNLFGFQDSIYYQVCVNGVCDIAGVEFYVIFRNTVPFAGVDNFSVELNTPRSGNVGLNDGDPDSITDPIDTSLDWFKFTNPTNGIVNVFSIDGSFTYTPNTGFIGNDSFQYYVVDHCGLYAISTVNLTVVGPNLNPTASDQTINSLSEDVAYSGNLVPLVSDPENDAITFTTLSAPASGNLVLYSNGTYTYTPVPNFTGTVSFTYNACDAVGQCDQGIVSLTINNVDNDPPQLTNDNKIINEDSTGLINASTNDFDDTGTMTYSVFSQPANGTATLINANGQFSYTPNTNYFGFDSFIIQACDGVNCATSTVSIQINGINDAPQASPFSIVLNEDTNSSGIINTLTDAEPNALVISTPGGNSITGLTINSNGTYNYTAPANYSGTQTINIQGCDPQGLCATTTLTVIINPVNDLPVVSGDTYTINEDQSISGNLSNGEYDVEGNALSYSALQSTTGGILNLNTNGQFTYTPNPNWFGQESINVQVCDQQNGCAITPLVITVNSVNDLPTASAATLNTNEDAQLSGSLASFTSDVETAQLLYSIQNQPASGLFNLSSDGSFNFTPQANFAGTLSASYQVCDASNACTTGIITINVASINDSPVATNPSLTINEDQSTSGVFSGITDIDNTNLTITITTPAQFGTFTLTNNAAYSYIPNANFFGNETITYSVCDPLGLCASGIITIQINSVEDVPVAIGESIAVIEGNLLSGDVSVNDSDGDSDPLIFELLSNVQNGTINFNSNGTFSYMPDNGFIGSETLAYLVCDDNNNCSSASLTIDVLTSNTAPIAQSSAITINEDEVLSGNLLSNITDAEGGIFTFTTLQAPEHASLLWQANGAFTLTPDANYNGQDSFEFRACDNGGLCADATITITINAINDPPVFTLTALFVAEDESITTNTAANVYDVEADLISYSILLNADNGLGTLSSEGLLTYTPNPNYYGTDSITLQACDANGACSQSIQTITITPVNDTPDASISSYIIEEDELLSGLLTELVYHADEENLFFGTMLTSANGTLTIQNSGEFIYTPLQNFFGNDQFTYLTCDPFGACDTATIFIVITPLNDAPITTSESITISEDSTIEINLASNDFEIENQALTYSLIDASQLGTAILSATGNLSYTAHPNESGTEILQINVCDSEGLCATSITEIIIESVNDLPIIEDPTFTLEEDAILEGSLEAWVTDIEGSSISFTLLSGELSGTFELNENGSFTYVPAANFHGAESISFEACDNESGCSQGIITLAVLAINDAPQAQNTQITLSEDSATEGDFHEFSSDDDGEDLFFSVIQTTSNGTFITSAEGTFAYAPTANFFGLDTLWFVACDGSNACDTAFIVLEVTFINDIPIIVSEGFQVFVNTIHTGSVATNDIELDNEILVYALLEDNSGGSFSMGSDGSYTYIPAPDTTGLFTVNYAACDPCSACEYGTLTLFVVSEEEANTPPIASNFSGQICPGGTIAINMLNLISDSQDANSDLNLAFGTVNSGNYQLDSETQDLVYEASPFANEQIIIPYYVCDDGIIQMCDTGSIILDILPQSTIAITSFHTEQITCNGAANGSIEIEAQTSLGTINYSWNNGESTSMISQLSPGSYSVLISSDAPCPINQTAQFDITEPAILTASYELTDINGNPSTLGDAITLSIVGGTPSYAIEWITPSSIVYNESTITISDNGTFTYTVTDANNCMYTESIVIAGIYEPTNSAINVFPNPLNSDNELEIESNEEILRIEITDSKGSLIANEYPNRTKVNIQSGAWTSGIYMLRIFTSTGLQTERVLKQ